MKHSRKEKKRLIFITFSIIGVIIFLVATVYSDWQQIMKNNSKILMLTEQYKSLLDEEKALQSEVTKLKDPNYVARYAKEKYLYTSEGEIIIRSSD